MLDLVRDIGAFAGIGAFVGLAVLSMLYFSQSRDVRRLREWAGRAPERDAEAAEATAAGATERADEVQADEEPAPTGAEDAQRVEQETAADREQRRQRRELGMAEPTRTERVRERFSSAGRRMPEARYVAVVIGGVIVVGAVVAVLALSVLGGGGGNGKGSSSSSALTPSQIDVSVLNATDVSGLATQVGTKVENKGYKLGAVTNSPSQTEHSVVMFKRGHAPEAKKVAGSLHIPKTELMSNEIAGVSAGADIAVVVGQDMASSG